MQGLSSSWDFAFHGSPPHHCLLARGAEEREVLVQVRQFHAQGPKSEVRHVAPIKRTFGLRTVSTVCYSFCSFTVFLRLENIKCELIEWRTT